MSEAIDKEIAEIENRMSTDRDGYFRDNAIQERYQGLIEARDTGGPAPAPRSAGEARKAEIEKVMREDRNKYFGDKLDVEYQQLVAGAGVAPVKAAPKAPAPASPEAAAAIPAHLQAEVETWAQTDAARELVADWQAKGGVLENARFADEQARAFLETIPAETKSDFATQFDILPFGLQMAMRGELASHYVRPGFASPEQVSQFAGTVEGKSLVKEWGTAAPRLVHVVRERAARIVGRLSPKEREAFDFFINSVTGEEFSAMMRLLAKAA